MPQRGLRIFRIGNKVEVVFVNETSSLFANEIATYEAKKSQLLAEHRGKFVLVHGAELSGIYDSEQNALEEGYRRFGPVPLLIQQILPVTPEQSAPAMALGILAATQPQ
jgi:hypothetical protein